MSYDIEGNRTITVNDLTDQELMDRMGEADLAEAQALREILEEEHADTDLSTMPETAWLKLLDRAVIAAKGGLENGSNMSINTADLPAIPVATITATDGATLTLELRPEIDPDRGIRYTIRAVETDDDTETSGNWYGGETITEADRAAAEGSALNALNLAWGTGWDLTSLN